MKIPYDVCSNYHKGSPESVEVITAPIASRGFCIRARCRDCTYCMIATTRRAATLTIYMRVPTFRMWLTRCGVNDL
jgi:hypothetical protein